MAKKYVKGTGRSAKYKTEPYYQKERARSKELRERAIIAELQNPNTIYMLAGEPTYIHSTHKYYEAGLRTAREIATRALTKLISKTKVELNRLIPLLDAELQKVINFSGHSSWDSFLRWWQTEVHPFASDNIDNEALYYLMLLEKIKKQAASIGTYLYARRSKDASGNLNLSARTKLIKAGFVEADFQGISGEIVGSSAAITLIRQNQRNDLKSLVEWLVPKINEANDEYGEHIKSILQRNLGSNLNNLTNIDVNKTFGPMIGELSEYITNMFKVQTAKGAEVTFTTVAPEKRKKNKANQTTSTQHDTHMYYKADTKIDLKMGSVSLSFLSNDKTGMETQFGRDGKVIGFIDKFTAGLNSNTLSPKGLTDVDYITWDEIDPNIQDIFLYIVRNSDFMKRQSKSDKDIILAFFAWAKLITELVGAKQTISTMPIVIRMFNRLYPISDLMRQFNTVQGIDILAYVNKSYLNNYYKILKVSGITSAAELRKEKREVLRGLKGKATYSKLKAEINSTLRSLNGKIARTTYFSTSFRILLGNVDNLKELAK